MISAGPRPQRRRPCEPSRWNVSKTSPFLAKAVEPDAPRRTSSRIHDQKGPRRVGVPRAGAERPPLQPPQPAALVNADLEAAALRAEGEPMRNKPGARPRTRAFGSTGPFSFLDGDDDFFPLCVPFSEDTGTPRQSRPTGSGGRRPAFTLPSLEQRRRASVLQVGLVELRDEERTAFRTAEQGRPAFINPDHMAERFPSTRPPIRSPHEHQLFAWGFRHTLALSATICSPPFVEQHVVVALVARGVEVLARVGPDDRESAPSDPDELHVFSCCTRAVHRPLRAPFAICTAKRTNATRAGAG